MLDKKRIITMSKMEIYEKGKGKKDLKISTYNKYDYVTLHIIFTLLWTTIGYFLVVAACIMSDLEQFLSSLTVEMITELAIIVVASLVITLSIFGVISGFYYADKYKKARKNARPYYARLAVLNKTYAKEREV